jgi:hypothetical protein
MQLSQKIAPVWKFTVKNLAWPFGYQMGSIFDLECY